MYLFYILSEFFFFMPDTIMSILSSIHAVCRKGHEFNSTAIELYTSVP